MPAKLTHRDDLGLALTFLRRIRNWDQSELAEASGVNVDSVRALERTRRRRPSFKTLGPITAALGADLGVLAEVVALIRRLRDAGSIVSQTTKTAFMAAPTLRREITSLVVAGCQCGGDRRAPGEQVAQAQGPVSRDTGHALGLALAFLRWIKGRTQEDLAALSGVSLISIEELEVGRREHSTLATLSRLESALEVAPATLAELAGLISELGAGMAAATRDANEVIEAGGIEAFGPARALRHEIIALIQATCARDASGRVTLDRAADKERVAVLRKRLERGGAVRIGMITRMRELQTAAFCELLCDESLKAAPDSAQRARRLAELAVEVAERVNGPDGWRSRMLGYAGVHVANAMRVDGNDLPAAGETFERARAQWEAGAEADPGLLNAARVMSLEASLRRAQRRVPEALAVLNQALGIDQWGETPSLLLGKARALFQLGDYEASISVLQSTVGHIDAEREPRLRCVALDLMLHNLCLLGQPEEAAEGLSERRALGLKLGNRLDLLRLTWLEGKIAAGMGRSEEAIALLEEVRARFVELKSSYHAALVTVELAEVLAGLGRHAEVKAIARESAGVFRDQRVHIEAQRALDLFCRAAEQEGVSTELLRGLLAYLYRAQQDPQLRFVAAA
jgi:transcriptional regulator with XRE-family HTH domain/tetratricopeptide (TPR) repeat protein